MKPKQSKNVFYNIICDTIDYIPNFFIFTDKTHSAFLES